MSVSRRDFLSGTVGAAALLGLGACSSVHSGGTGGSSTGGAGSATTTAPSNGTKTNIGKVSGTLTFAFWGGSDGENAGFKYAKDKFEAANPGAKVNFKVSEYSNFFSGIDRGIQTGNAPDIFRVDYTTIGKYSKAGALLDVSPYFSSSEIGEFIPALWDAVKYNGTPYGVPHQTDTTCVVYNKQAFQRAGITSVPDSLANSWSWDEFSAVAKKLRASLPSNQFPFAYDWTQAGAFRWLSWLYQAGGTLLNSDLTKCALPSDPATKALDYTKSFFDQKWVPASGKIKTNTYSDNFFLNGVVPMTFIGDFLVPELADKKTGYKKGDWAATYMPQDKAKASDLGGNAIVATKNTKNADLAAAFLKFLVSEDIMKYFCEQAVELPTRQTLVKSSLDYAYRPDVVKVCAEQATTISGTNVKEVTNSAFATINTVLQDQLEAAFNGQSTDATLGQIASKVNQAL